MVAGTSFLRAIAKEAAPVKALEIINLCQPSQVREFPYGQLELFHIAGQVIGRATYSRSRLATTAGWSATSHTPPSTCSAPTPTPSPPRAESSMRPREPEPASPTHWVLHQGSQSRLNAAIRPARRVAREIRTVTIYKWTVQAVM